MEYLIATLVIAIIIGIGYYLTKSNKSKTITSSTKGGNTTDSRTDSDLKYDGGVEEKIDG